MRLLKTIGVMIAFLAIMSFIGVFVTIMANLIGLWFLIPFLFSLLLLLGRDVYKSWA